MLLRARAHAEVWIDGLGRRSLGVSTLAILVVSLTDSLSRATKQGTTYRVSGGISEEEANVGD